MIGRGELGAAVAAHIGAVGLAMAVGSECTVEAAAGAVGVDLDALVDEARAWADTGDFPGFSVREASAEGFVTGVLVGLRVAGAVRDEG